jgi:hypothetical protein
VSLINHANVANLEGRYEDGTTFALAALTVALDHQNRIVTAPAAMEIARPTAEQGEPERAARLLGALSNSMRKPA